MGEQGQKRERATRLIANKGRVSWIQAHVRALLAADRDGVFPVRLHRQGKGK